MIVILNDFQVLTAVNNFGIYGKNNYNFNKFVPNIKVS